eukprot:Phypoly_transcript_15580.p1 GENE.Phypoly_transcript_15580~~Phypoly_transcript_15580.p1  ORF type:complete len:296 (+),score=63.26 Phypoly_transcript_15580:30-890(+)
MNTEEIATTIRIFDTTTTTTTTTTTATTNTCNETNTIHPTLDPPKNPTNAPKKQQKAPKQPKDSKYKYIPQSKPPKADIPPGEKKKQTPAPHTTKRQALDIKSLSINEKCEMEDAQGKGKKKGFSTPPPSVTQILPHLYLGSAVNAADSALVSSLGLGAVLNVAEELEKMVEHEGVESVRMIVHDFMPDGMNQHSVFEEAFALIDKAKETNKPILVHCMRGRSRSATIVIAYLMTRERWTLKTSHAHVKKLRPYIGPHRRLKKQLMLYERHLYGNITVGPGEGWSL